MVTRADVSRVFSFPAFFISHTKRTHAHGTRQWPFLASASEPPAARPPRCPVQQTALRSTRSGPLKNNTHTQIYTHVRTRAPLFRKDAYARRARFLLLAVFLLKPMKTQSPARNLEKMLSPAGFSVTCLPLFDDSLLERNLKGASVPDATWTRSAQSADFHS